VLTLPALLAFVIVIVFLGLPVWWYWRLVWLFVFHSAVPSMPDEQLPEAAVLLPLRGADPSLRECLRGLLRQDYPRYSVRIVIDSLEDPAWELVQSVLAEDPNSHVNVKVSPLKQLCQTCTLKLSAQMQTIAELEDMVEVITLIDADVVPPRDWLRTLVAPFTDPRVGCVSGVRWFMPAQPSWGALLRQLWNAGAQAQMAAFGLPWGGSMALHARIFRDRDLLRQWERNYADDSGAGDLLRRLGLKVRTLPALTMVNREAIGLHGCMRFLPRQIIGGRIDLSAWPLLLGANLGVLAALILAGTFTVLGLVLGQVPWMICFGLALLFYLTNTALAFLIIETRIRQIGRARGEDVPAPAPAWRLLLAGILAQVVHFFALAQVLCARRIRWRGVDYHIDGHRRLRLVQYGPYQPSSPGLRGDHSIV
jgi:Glycosyl transferase family 21